MKRSEFRFFDALRVRWAEVDMQKIVFNGHYLMYVDTAVAGYWRAMAMPYAETMAALGGDLYVRKATLEYLGSAQYDDRLEVGIRCARIGNSSMNFVAAVFRGDVALVSAELVYVYADPATQTSRPVPAPLREALLGFEAGELMFEVTVGSWADLGEAAHPVRREVFIDEQKIPAELEWDSADNAALHAVARNRFGMTLGAGRMVALQAGVAKIGRMAVLRSSRGSGIGRALLEALASNARESGCHELVLHAQRSAESFYASAGFAPRGAGFEEAGIAHIEMVRAP